MKKTMVILMAAVCLTTAAFAQEADGTGMPSSKNTAPFRLSIGGGGMLSADMSTWKVDEDVTGDLDRYNASTLSTAPYIFLDMKYIEVNAGLLLGQAQNSNLGNPTFPADTLGLTFGAYLKLPFTLSGMFTLYPMLGADYDLYLLSKKSDDRDAQFPVGTGETGNAMEALSNVSFKIGAGLDTYFTDHLFLRTELLYGIGIPNKMDSYLKDARNDVEWQLSHSGEFKLAIGYRF
jgi:opacity protein-like surface antigen